MIYLLLIDCTLTGKYDLNVVGADDNVRDVQGGSNLSFKGVFGGIAKCYPK